MLTTEAPASTAAKMSVRVMRYEIWYPPQLCPWMPMRFGSMEPRRSTS